MEKLVIQYNVGDDCTYSCDVTIPLIYESKDKALFDLELLIEQHFKDLEKNNDDVAKWEDRRIVLSNKKNKEEDWLMKHFAEKPKDISDSFSFGNQTLHFSHFYYRGDKKLEISMPTIVSVEEWYKAG